MFCARTTHKAPRKNRDSWLRLWVYVGLAAAFASAIEVGPDNFETVSKATATAFIPEGKSREAIEECYSILLKERGCGFIQNVLQSKTLQCCV